MAKDDHAGVDVAEFIATVGLRHAYRLSYLTSAIVTAGYDAVKRETGLIRGEYLLLLCLSHQKISTAQDVARMTRRPRNTISRAVHRMLDEGYIDRAPDPSDGRQSKLTLTAKGRAMQTRIEQILSEREEEVVAPLSADDHASFDAILQKLVRHAASLKD